LKRLVAIPLYNEESYIRAVLDIIRKHFDEDILVVNDGSTDSSGNILETLKSEFGLCVITRKNNIGYGQSIIDSFKFALNNKYDQLVTIDCDEQHEPHRIPQMFKNLDNVDVCSGSRYILESELDDAPPPDRRAINEKVTSIINMITGYNLTDTFCGMKGYRVEGLRPLDLKETGYAFPIEFWVQAYHFGLSVKECPISRIYKNQSRTFGQKLDDPKVRMAYYYSVLEKELKRWSISLPLELTLTI
jgi:glycosyltransferase involved in cell wall biosynthesis